MIGESYLSPDFALELQLQSHKVFGDPPVSEIEQLFELLNLDFKSPSVWVSTDRKPGLPNCEWAVGPNYEKQF